MSEQKPDKESTQPVREFIRFLMIWFACFLLFNFIGAFMVALFSDQSFENIDIQKLFSEENIWLLKLMQIIVSAGSFLLPPFIYVFLRKKRFSKYFGLDKVPSAKLLLSTVVIMLLSGPLVYWLLQLNQSLDLPESFNNLEQYLQGMESDNQDVLIQLLSMENFWQLLVNLFMVAILPGVGEELLFRGVLQRILSKLYRNPHLGIFAAAMIFSFIHFQFYGFLPRMALGMLFGYLYYWSGSLWYPIIAHTLHNGSQVLMVYSLGTDFNEQEMESMGQFSPYMIMIATVFLLISLARFQFITKQSS